VKQFETLRFPTDPMGQRERNDCLSYLTQHGWRILGETIEQGHMKGGDACCLAMICLPMGFAAGRTPNVTMVNIERDIPAQPVIGEHSHRWRLFDANRSICQDCDKIKDRYAW
jgi:hypothetical protein